MRTSVALFSLGFVLLFAQIGHAQDGPLKILSGGPFLVTGDVVVGGTSLYRKGAANGLATVNINITGVPNGAETLAAFLYIQTTVRESQGPDAGIARATFKGNALNLAGGPLPLALNWDAGTQACWSYGWNPRRRLVTYRLDALRFLEIDTREFLPPGQTVTRNPNFGKHIVNGNHQVQVADAGRGNIFNDDEDDGPSMTGPRAVGASLVVIYRHPDPLADLRAVVIVDGGVTKRSFETFTQRIQGVYQPTANPDARMIHIVGDGQAFFSEKVRLGAQIFPANPFVGANGPRWDNKTFNLAPSTLQPYPDAANLNTVSVTPNGLLSDCLSWSAIVVSTKVQDTDHDGLLDIWESWDSLAGTNPIRDPKGHALPDLKAMGADPNVKDMFFQIDYLQTRNYTGDIDIDSQNDHRVSYGGVSKPGHSHGPTEEALKIIGDTFASAPVLNPDGSPGPGPIKVHFDIGNIYQTSPYVIRCGPLVAGKCSYALGGKAISETRACPGPTVDSPPVECTGPIPGQYPDFPGTVGWKTGFRYYRDEILGFDSGRKDIFRSVVSGHFLGLPQSEFPCLEGTTPKPYPASGICNGGLTDNPAFHIPRTNAGIADWAGGDIYLALGGFDDSDGRPVGTAFMWASTLAHESGHNLGRRHGGDLFEPNGKPLYFSVMNYLYQLRGLLPDPKGSLRGIAQLDFHRGINGVQPHLPEPSLSDGSLNFPGGILPYRIGWYAPKADSYLKNQTSGEATKHLDGTPLLTDQFGVPTEPLMVRLDATSVSDVIDWNADGQQNSAFSQDLNFDGLIAELGATSSDWAKFRLNQVGARRNVGGLFLDKLGRPTIGPMSLDTAKGDLAKGDLAKGDLAKGDLAKGDLAKGDLAKGDLAKGDLGVDGGGVVNLSLGKGDVGRGDLGGGDLDVGGPGEPFAEIDKPTADAVTGGNPTPPSALNACLTTSTGDSYECVSEGGGDIPVRLDWQKPNIGKAVRYLIYRFEIDPEVAFPPDTLPTEEIDSVGGEGTPPTTYLDFYAPAGKHLAYFLKAEYDDESLSGISNFATVETPSAGDPPIAGSSVLPVCGDQGDSPFTGAPTGSACTAYTQVPNVQLYQVPLSLGPTGALRIDYVYKGGSFNNELVAFRVDDASAAIGSLHPGDEGYLTAAFARSQVLFPSTSTATSGDFVLGSGTPFPVTGAIHAGDWLAFFIVQDATFIDLKETNSANSASGTPVAFFSINSLNPDGDDHLVVFSRSEPDMTEFGFEDLTGLGDSDFDDLVFTIRVTGT